MGSFMTKKKYNTMEYFNFALNFKNNNFFFYPDSVAMVNSSGL